jgi:nitrogen fixation protein FixH
MDTTAWRWFPAGLIASMAVVFAINGYMVYDAVSTFPGAAGQDGFDLSNEYKRVLATAQQQAALGWRIEADATAAHVPVLHLTDANGKPLVAASIEAQAERPIGPVDATALSFRPIEGGKYQADTTLYSGQWDIMLTVHASGRQYSATRRVVVQ